MSSGRFALFWLYLTVVSIKAYAFNAPQVHTEYLYRAKTDSMELAWIFPQSESLQVGQFEKLELGVTFTDEVNQWITNFTNGVRNGTKLNPFNPEDIDLYAEFYWSDQKLSGQWQGPKRINGFYYEEFEVSNQGWNKLENKYQFRVRFAPRILGLWKFRIHARIKGYGVVSSPTLKFLCVPSGSTDFVSVAANQTYLQIGDQPFFPVGQNVEPASAYSKTTPSDFIKFHQVLRELRKNGANYYRYLVSPWNTEIEFEQLNNYSRRMSSAWEFDRILNLSDSLGLHLQWNMQIHYAFEKPSYYAMYYWDWPKYGDSLNTDAECVSRSDSGYCYRSYLNLENPVDFLTDSLALVNYKHRIRYMIARWGYSTSIGSLELVSEISNFGSHCKMGRLYDKRGRVVGCVTDSVLWAPYKDSPDKIAPLIYNWQSEIARFIKVDLQHTDHLITANYGPPINIAAGDSTYFSPYIDIMSFNSYALSSERYVNHRKTVDYYRDTTNQFGLGIKKPVINSEYGPGYEEIILNDQYTEFIRGVNLLPFTGIAGAFNWDYQTNRDSVWKYLQAIVTFMNETPLNQGNWQYEETFLKNKSGIICADIMILSSSENWVVGAISNRSFNWYSQGNDASRKFGCEPEYQKEFELNPVSRRKFGSVQFQLPVMLPAIPYRLEWYHGITGDLILEQEIRIKRKRGKIKLTLPTTLTGNSTCPIIFFKLIPLG